MRSDSDGRVNCGATAFALLEDAMDEHFPNHEKTDWRIGDIAYRKALAAIEGEKYVTQT